jgi:hypothetical protein
MNLQRIARTVWVLSAIVCFPANPAIISMALPFLPLHNPSRDFDFQAGKSSTSVEPRCYFGGTDTQTLMITD